MQPKHITQTLHTSMGEIRHTPGDELELFELGEHNGWLFDVFLHRVRGKWVVWSANRAMRINYEMHATEYDTLDEMAEQNKTLWQAARVLRERGYNSIAELNTGD